MSPTERSFTVVRLADPASGARRLIEDVRMGFQARPKRIPPKYFYDARGSELFERITRLPEYYLTRAETEILEREAASVLALVRPHELVELGSGSSRKTELLITAMLDTDGSRYVAFDVSEDALCAAAERLTERHPELEVEVVVGDFDGRLDGVERTGRRLVLLLGSTIGNIHPDQRSAFLARVRTMLLPGDRFLLGVDLVKDRATLEAAYDDASGITAEFNANVLRVLNRELDGDLPLDAFEHVAFYDEANAWIEMRLCALRALDARLDAIDLDVHFDAGEEIRTEISCKFTRASVTRALTEAGLALERWIPDPGRRFALVLARRR